MIRGTTRSLRAGGRSDGHLQERIEEELRQIGQRAGEEGGSVAVTRVAVEAVARSLDQLPVAQL